ncbi:MAG TPA: hypothetical protein VNI20_01880, partial [Fimbriimonadaceae bacterium]|nr:hypothetical protein [Fimbriimonadaceae bacterium]
GANFAESAMYLGPFLLLLIAGLRKREQWSKAGGVACAGAVGLLLAFGTPLNAALYYLMPGWSATGSPGRAIALFVIAACALAGIGWPAEEDKEWRRRSMVFGAVVAMLLALGLLLGGAVSAYSPEMNELLRVARAQCLSAAFPLLLLCLVLCASIVYLWQKGPKWLAIGVVCVGQLLVIGTGLIPTSAVPFQRGTPDPARRVAFVNDNWDLRIGVPVSVPPNVGVEMGLYDVAGYDSLLDKDTVRHLHEIDGQDPAPPANGNMMFIKPGADTAKLAASGVTEVWRLSDYSLGAGGQLIKEPVVGPGRASLEGGTAKITYDGPTSQTVETQGAGTLVVRDRKMEGWSATLDGKPATIEGTLWRDIEVPAGTHKVRFIYVPPGLMAGLGLMGLAILACIGLGWRRGEA